MEIQYTVKNNSICIDKIADPNREVIIPEHMEGLLVTELGAYALSGTSMEEIVLPPGIVKIGAYAFYNCEMLRRISCYGRAVDLGAGIFANDRGIGLFELTNFPGERSCFKEMLGEMRQTLRVRLYADEKVASVHAGGSQTRRFADENAGEIEARLIFPEYFEEAVENTPGRKIEVETHGCGQRYRYCFVRREFQFAAYDELFPYAQVQESGELVCELAIGRLQYPVELRSRAREAYRSYLQEHCLTAAKILIAADRMDSKVLTNLDAGSLPWLLEGVVQVSREQLGKIIAEAQKAGDTEMVSWLMNYRYERFGAGQKTFSKMGEPAGEYQADFDVKEVPEKRRRFEI